MELTTVRDAFDRVVKKQKLSTSKFQEVVDLASHEVEQTLASIQTIQDSSPTIDLNSALSELKTKLSVINTQNQLEKSQKELNINLSKVPKVLEKIFNPDITKAYRNVNFDSGVINQIIVNHFYFEGLFDIADSLINEAGELEVMSLRYHFVKMHHILEAMRARNLEPALSWVTDARENLRQIGSNLELNLRRLQFVEILQTKPQADALNYARTQLSPFASLHMVEIQKLMGCLLWAGNLETSPYSDFLLPIRWEELTKELTQQFCSMAGQPSKSPLATVLEAGVEGLPTLLKLANVMAAKKQEWHSMKQLPVPVDLGKQFQFHSIFVCPVSRDQSSDENPPMILRCGHVLCNQSIVMMLENDDCEFKCPNCPYEASAWDCRRLHL